MRFFIAGLLLCRSIGQFRHQLHRYGDIIIYIMMEAWDVNPLMWGSTAWTYESRPHGERLKEGSAGARIRHMRRVIGRSRVFSGTEEERAKEKKKASGGMLGAFRSLVYGVLDSEGVFEFFHPRRPSVPRLW